MGRNAINPNVDAPSGREHTSGSEWADPSSETEREGVREEVRASGAALDASMTEREANSRREVPRLDTEAANPNKDRKLAPQDAVRNMLSSNMKKQLNKVKSGWVDGLPKSRRLSLNRSVGSLKSMAGINRALHQTVGVRSELPPSVNRRVSDLDRSIQEYEGSNERQHIVYATLAAPKPHGNSRNALVSRLKTMSEVGDQSLTFDGYIASSHSLGNINAGPDVVMEIRTRSGAYLGTSDTTPNADHIVGRGRVLRPVGVHEVSYALPDGTRSTRTVVQMEDVSED